MSNTRLVPVLLAAALAFPFVLQAQDYPSKPIKIIVPNPAGGGNDFVGRVLGDRLREKWGQPVLVENRAGASGVIGAEAAAKSAPDGYTVLVTAPASLVINKHLYAKLPYDPDAFVPVSIVAGSPGVLLAHPGIGVSTVQQLVAYAKANPGRLSYASQGNGTISHLAGELFDLMGSVKSVHVPYKGTAPAMADLLGGQVNIMFGELSTSLKHIGTGKLRALAVGSEKRNRALPDVPTLSEALPGFAFSFWMGMVAPAGTPAAIVNKLAAAAAEVNQPEVAKKLLDVSLEPIGSTPAEMASFLKRESERWGKVIRITGMKAQ